MTAPDTERIAREAVALCADLLRRFTWDESTNTMCRTSYVQHDVVQIWARRVLAWQEALDDTILRQ